MTGSGTLLDPYVIWDVNDLQDMSLDLTAYYELGQNIDASATIGWNAGLGFAPVGPDALNKFEGELDGNEYTVSSLFINRPAAQVGLFGRIGGVVKNIGLVNCDITGLYGGALAAGNHGTVDRCYTTGIVVSPNYTNGGLAGYNYGTIQRSYSECSVTVTGGTGSTGGLVGANNHAAALIDRCYATGAVDTVWSGGGLVGANLGTINDCYARGSVNGDEYAGGFIGVNSNNITRCYSTGTITSVNLARGFCAINNGTITDSFWDTQTSGQATSAGGTGKTTIQMKTESTFTGAGWDFATIWTICSGVNNNYPCLLGVTPSCVLTPAVPYVINKSYALAGEEL